MGTIRIPKKTKPVPKPKRKPGTRAGLTKAGIAAAAAKLIESVGPGGFSVRKLAKAIGVGPTSIHAHFKGGIGAVLDAVAAQAVAGTTRPFKPMEEPAEYLRELFQKILESLHARPEIAGLVILRLRPIRFWIRCWPNVYFWHSPHSAYRRTRFGQSGNKSGRPKDLANFGELLMKEFYKTVIVSMGGKTVKRSQGGRLPG
jgi:Bacterial regulatory proteins, tetR family